jgi:phage terminase large subunit-like protein
MVEATLRAVDANVSFRDVHARKGKLLRAEPISALYEQGRVHHVGAFPQLEDQMCSYAGGGDSPDRLDALVYCLTELMSASQTTSFACGGGAPAGRCCNSRECCGDGRGGDCHVFGA